MNNPRYLARSDDCGAYGVWDTYLRLWVDTDAGITGLSEGDAKYIADELNGKVEATS